MEHALRVACLTFVNPSQGVLDPYSDEGTSPVNVRENKQNNLASNCYLGLLCIWDGYPETGIEEMATSSNRTCFRYITRTSGQE
jgi:hypothetical protein